MKKLLFLLLSIFLTCGIWSYGQDPNPLPSISVKKLIAPNSPTLYYDQTDSLVKMFKGQYEWTWLIGKSYSDRYLVPYDNALRDVNLGNRNITSTKQNLPINVGVVVVPTHVKNGDGTVTLGANGTYNFAKSADGSTGIAQKVVVSGTTITLTDQAVNFIYVDYNGGSPVYATTLDNLIFKDDFTKVPVIRATREGTTVHFEEYDLYGLLLANKLMVKDVYLNGGRRLSGLILSTAATRISTISAGSSVFAVQYYDNMAANIAGTSGSLYEYYLSGGVWNRSLVTSYDAIYYSDGTNRQLLGNNKWVAKYYFRDIGDDNEAYYVHGHEYNNKSDAVNELIPATPPVMVAHSVYVGKIVVEKNATNGTAYPRIWEGSVQNEGTSVHSDLSAESLVWSASGHTGTINNIAVFNGTGNAAYTPNNSTNWNTAYTHSQNDTDLSPTNEANTSLTYNQTTRVLSVTDPVATRSATLPLATTTVDGLMSKEDKTKLNTIPLIYKNGIYRDADSIKLGGTLTENTDINVLNKYLTMYGEASDTSTTIELGAKYLELSSTRYQGDIGSNISTKLRFDQDSITSSSQKSNIIASDIIQKPDKITTKFTVTNPDYSFYTKETVQDTTGIKYVNIPTAYFQDSTLVPKYYVDGLVGGTQTLSTNGNVGNISISSGNTITLNVNDHVNRTALDNVSGVNTGDQTLSGLGGEPKLNGTGFVKASGTTISYDNSTYEPAFSKNTAFNKNFGTTTGTVLEGRTFGTAANNNTGDFAPSSGSSNYIQASPATAQSAGINITGSGTYGGIIKSYGVLDSGSAATGKIQLGDNNVGMFRANKLNQSLVGNSLYIGAYDDIILTTSTSELGSQTERVRISSSTGEMVVGGQIVASGFSDGVNTYSAAQINRGDGGFVEMQYTGIGGVRMFGNTATPITFTGGSINAPTYKLNSTPLLLDWLKSGSAPTSGNIVVGNGTTTNPSGVSVNQAIGGNTLTSGYLPYWDGSKLANSIIQNIGGTIGVSGNAIFRNTILLEMSGDGIKIKPTTDNASASIFCVNAADTQAKWYILNNGYAYFGGTLSIGNLSGTGTRLVSATSDGTLSNIANGTEGQVLKIVSGVPQFNNESSGIADAPTDGLYYLRKDNAWDQTNAVTRSFSAYSLTLPSSRIIDELSGAMRIRNASYTNASFNSDGTTSFLYNITGVTASFSGMITADNFKLGSDRRIKQGIKPIKNIDFADKIKFVSYFMKSDTARIRYGVIAQDVERINPSFVYTDDKGMKSVDYIGILVSKIEALQRKVNELESDMKIVKRKIKRHEK